MISVVIPTRNEEALIARAIDSILGTYPDLEVVVVLDQCTDGTEAVVARYRNTLIRSVPNRGLPGLAGALNTGLAEARGEWIARLDADDTSERNRLSVQVSFAVEHGLDVCCGWARLMDADGGIRLIQSTPARSGEIARSLIRGNTIVHSSVLMRRDRVLALGGYRATRWEDYDLWVRLSRAGCTFGCVDQVVVTRYLRRQGYGETHGKSLCGRLDVLRLRLSAVPNAFRVR